MNHIKNTMGLVIKRLDFEEEKSENLNTENYIYIYKKAKEKGEF